MVSRISIPSCGLALLRSNSFDYTLWLRHENEASIQFVKIQCHKAVLLAHSQKMSEVINASNFWDCTIEIKPGYLKACIEVLQYMYLKDPTLISDLDKVLDVCAMFGMQYDHMVLQEHKLHSTDQFDTVQLQLEPCATATTVCADFLQNLTFPRAEMRERKVDTCDSACQTDVFPAVQRVQESERAISTDSLKWIPAPPRSPPLISLLRSKKEVEAKKPVRPKRRRYKL